MYYSQTAPPTAPPTASGRLKNFTLYRLDGGSVIESGGRFFVDMRDRLPFAASEDAYRLGFYTRIGSLLSRDTTNSKLIKSALNTDALSFIHYGAPARVSGFSMCSHASSECAKLCLNTSGNGRYLTNQVYRIARTRFEAYRPEDFWRTFAGEIDTAWCSLERSGKAFLAVRPNGTTDRFSDQLERIMLDRPDVRFYDYTAVPSRLTIADRLENYAVTLSRKETRSNHAWLRAEGYGRRNVAVVCTRAVKEQLLDAGNIAGIPTVDFDSHDLRLPEYDGVGVVGLLTPKGAARGVASGFIVSSVPQLTAEIVG